MPGFSLPLAFVDITGLPGAAWAKPFWLIGAAGICAFFVLAALFALLQAVLPKVAAITWTTAKEGVLQPMFYILLVGGMGLLYLSLYLPYFTFGEDTKVVEENGLTLVMLLSIILGLWTASVSLAEEIEGRTALTVLCKPISRRDFVFGKFLGILGPVAILFIVLGVFFLCSVSFKVSYDSRETSAPEPTSLQCLQEVEHIAPGLVLAFYEAAVMVAISVAISTRMGMLPNLVICASIYVLGHLVPMLAKSAMGQVPIVTFIADLLAAILPVLDHFNIYGPIATGENVPLAYLGWAGLYCLAYSSLAMLAALLMFEDRDLA
jgi:ABC-type transport system involved in multi-copper enzyme maturation permease subunit